MQKKSTCLAFALLAAFLAPAQEIFEKKFGFTGRSDELPNHILALPDGGCVVVGMSNSSGSAGDFDAFLMRVDSAGNMLWMRHFGGKYFDEALRVVSVPESEGGGFVLCGSTKTEDIFRDGFVLRTDAEGREIWRWTRNLDRETFVNSVAPDGAGNWLFCGVSYDSLFWGQLSGDGKLLFWGASRRDYYNVAKAIAPAGPGRAVLLAHSYSYSEENVVLRQILLPGTVQRSDVFSLDYGTGLELLNDSLGNVFVFGMGLDSTIVALKVPPAPMPPEKKVLASGVSYGRTTAAIGPNGQIRVLGGGVLVNDALFFFDWKLDAQLNLLHTDTVKPQDGPGSFYGAMHLSSEGRLFSASSAPNSCEDGGDFDVAIYKNRSYGRYWKKEWLAYSGENVQPGLSHHFFTGRDETGRFFTFFRRKNVCAENPMHLLLTDSKGNIIQENKLDFEFPLGQIQVVDSKPRPGGGLWCLLQVADSLMLWEITPDGNLASSKTLNTWGNPPQLFDYMVPRPGGGFALLPYFESVSPGTQDVLLYDDKANLVGIRIWSQGLLTLNAICSTRDNGFAAVGWSDTEKSLMLLRFNEVGDEIWRLPILQDGRFRTVSSSSHRSRLLQASDGGFVYFSSINIYRLALKTDASGVLRQFWSSEGWYGEFRVLEEISSGFVVVGETEGFAPTGSLENTDQIRLHFFPRDNFNAIRQNVVLDLDPAALSFESFVPGFTLDYWGQTIESADVLDLYFLKIAFPPVPISSFAPENQLEIQPNPSPGAFCVRFDSDETGRVEIELFAADGSARRFFHFEKPEKGVFQQTLLPGDLQTGLYFVRARLGGAIWAGRFLKSGR